MKEALITCENLALGYENHIAVQGVTLTVEEGDYLCLVGENGSGKSTLMKGFTGLLKPLHGSLEFPGLKNKAIGYLPQQTEAQKDFPATVTEVVRSGCLSKHGLRPFYTSNEKEIARHNMEMLNILDLKKKCYRELSGGQQQRVLIARALCAADKILFLDEPVTGLDPAATADFYAVLAHLNKSHQVAIVMVSHDISNALAYATKILHLKKDVLFYGSTEQYRHSDLGRTYSGGEGHA